MTTPVGDLLLLSHRHLGAVAPDPLSAESEHIASGCFRQLGVDGPQDRNGDVGAVRGRLLRTIA